MHVLAPPTVEVEFRGEVLTVTPITVGELPAFTRALQPAAGAILALGQAAGSGSEILAAAGLLDEHADAVTELIAVGIRRPAAWVRGTTRPEEVLSLLGVVMKVNDDFFRRRLALAWAGQQAAQTGGAGPTPHSTSSPPAMH